MAESDFPVADMIRQAASDTERAKLLLRLPDSVCWETGGHLCAACAATGFRIGVLYIMARLAAFAAVHWTNGLTPDAAADQVGAYRRTMCELAGVTP